MKPTPNQAVIGGGAGASIGMVLVVLLPKFTDVEFDATEASTLTAAFGVIASWLIRYLRHFLPKRRGGLMGVLLLGVLLGGCGFTPQGNAFREAIKAGGARAMDEGVNNCVVFLGKGASVGSIGRWLKTEADAGAYKTLFQKPAAVPVGP